MALTSAQQRLLEEVVSQRVVVKNGKARVTAQALERAGLVTIEYDMIPHAKGNGIELTTQLTIRATERAV